MIGFRPVGGEFAARYQAPLPFGSLRFQGIGNVLQVGGILRQQDTLRQVVKQIGVEKGHGVERRVLEEHALFQQAQVALPLFAHFRTQAAMVERAHVGGKIDAAPRRHFIGRQNGESGMLRRAPLG